MRAVPGGMLAAFEGVDGAGKTTQALAARDRLAALGYTALYLREPTSGLFGQRIRELMTKGRDTLTPVEEFELFLADREEDARLNIRPALASGAVVCIDRYYISSMAYQGALGLDPDFIREQNEKIAPKPDLILYFHIPVETGIARIQASRPGGQNLFEMQHYQEQVAAIFDAMIFPQMIRIDATADPEAVQSRVVSEIVRCIGQRQNAPNCHSRT